MSDFEYNYSDKQLDLILNRETTHKFSEKHGDYIRMTVFSKSTEIFLYSFYSNRLQSTGELIENPSVIGEDSDSIGIQPILKEPQIKIYRKDDNDYNIYIKPNEILEKNLVPSGNYILRFDFLKNTIPNKFLLEGLKYIVKEVSPSRKEVRLILKSSNVENEKVINFDDESFVTHFMRQIGSVEPDCIPLKDYDVSELPFDDLENGYYMPENTCYNYDFVLTLGSSVDIPINNYTFDSISYPDLPATLILRLNQTLPTSIAILDEVGIEKEVMITQTQNIIYYSNIKTTLTGFGLSPDTSFLTDDNISENDSGYQNYEELIGSSSLDSNVSDKILLLNDDENKNLNINFNEFENHTFFGSAAQKLENFKYKVGLIQNQLMEISKSLEFNNSTGSQSGSAAAYPYQELRRQTAFSEITKIVKDFTPYEKFLYYDGQTESTSSAPGVGINYALATAAYIGDPNNEGQSLSNYDGFSVVYKHSNDRTTSPEGDKVDLFKNQYFAHKAPFFNYTGSVYISFLLKGNEGIKSSAGDASLFLENTNQQQNPPLPHDTFVSESVVTSAITMSAYRPFVFRVSQSYWRPTSTANPPYSTEGVDTAAASNTYEILSGSNITGSDPGIIAGTGYQTFPDAFGANTSFTGSVLPMGELFRISYLSGSGQASGNVTSSFITDIKVTTTNPTGTLPFGQVYTTGSTTFTNWYDKMYYSASVFDDNNIHSLKNNLPEYIQIDSSSNDLKKFLGMWGEQFDLTRNYIDGYTKFYKRNYKGYDVVPSNLLPILSDNLGWELINPFSSSLAEYFSTMTGSNNTVKDITHNTWKKTLNNLIYIYKSKGTMNSVRALLNIYGYVPDSLPLTEYGGSYEEHNPVILNNTETTFKSGLKNSSGNISFIEKSKILYSLNLKQGTNKLNLDWWSNPKTSGPDGIEFLFSAIESPNTQTLLKSSGSLTQSLWDLRLVKSGSSYNKGKLEFRLNYKTKGSGSLSNNAFSMSTDYVDDLKGGSIWNAYLTRLTGSTESDLQQQYKLYLAKQDDDAIPVFKTATMTVYSSSDGTSGSISNLNFISGSGLASTVSGNLVVGETFSGSMADIRVWSGALSASIFKQHVLNKFSIVGNDISGSQDNLIWRYRLNENYASGTSPQSLKDSSRSRIQKNYNKDFNFTNDGRLYNKQVITTYQLSPRGLANAGGTKNDNKILIDTKRQMKMDLNPYSPSFLSVYDKNIKKREMPSTKISFTKSPTDTVDEHILNQLSDKQLDKYIGKPSDIYESKYEDLEILKNRILDGVEVDFNTYVTSQENIMSPILLNAVKSLLPGRSRIGEVGVVLKPNILERLKNKATKVSFSSGSAAGDFSFDTVISGTISESMSYLQPYSSSISMISGAISHSINYNPTYNFDNINVISESISESISFVYPYSSSLHMVSGTLSESISYSPTYNFNAVSVVSSSISQSITFNPFINFDTVNVPSSSISESISFVNPYSASLFAVSGTISESISFVNPYSASVSMISGTISESLSYSPTHNFNDISMISNSISHSISYDGSYNLNINNILDDYIIYEDSSSNIINATGSITFLTAVTASLAGGEIEIESVDGTSVTYILDATASFNVTNTPRVGLSGSTSKAHIATRLSRSIAHSNGHNKRIAISDFQFFSASNGAFYASESVSFAPNTIGKLVLTQATSSWKGNVGNKTINSSLSTDYMTVSGFDSGQIGKTTANVLKKQHANISESISYNPYYNFDTIDIPSSSVSESISWINPHSSSIDIPSSSMSASIIFNPDQTASISLYKYWGTDEGLDTDGDPYPKGSDGSTRTHLWQTWGRGLNDTHFYHDQPTIRSPKKREDEGLGTDATTKDAENALSMSRQTGSFNVYHYNHFEFVSFTIGDYEVLSGSIKQVSCSDNNGLPIPGNEAVCINYFEDYTNHRNHLNRKIINPDIGPNKNKYGYKNYIRGVNNIISGSPMGRTLFFSSSADGEITYPINHYNNYHVVRDQLSRLYYEGSLSTGSNGVQYGPSIFDDDPTAAFYTKNVGGSDTDSILRVENKTNRPKGRRN